MKTKILISILSILLVSSNLYAQNPRTELSPYSDTIPQSSLSSSQADSIFNFIVSNKHLIDLDDCNICKSRAHIITRIIEKYFPAVTPAKVWLIADCKRSSRTEHYKYKPAVLLQSPGKCSNWSYHVAPVIITANDTIVIDPSTQTKPESLSKWAGDIIPQNGAGFLIIKDKRYYIYPQNKDDLFLDENAVWDINDNTLTDHKYLRSVDETLQAKHKLYEPWKFNYYISELMKLLE
ncbi:MAG: hypothetical protein HOP31_11400 [Ignavibacteria bacterium]|nr:hypothetical protein [Ignavibacteria bacterium]